MQDMEAIITDLYKLDPELASHDTEVRSLVAGLIAQQPKPVPDQVFVERLRRKLLMSAPEPALTWQTVLWHLMPVGAVAVLVFMLVPSYTSTVPYSVVVPTAVPESASDAVQGSEKTVQSQCQSQRWLLTLSRPLFQQPLKMNRWMLQS